MALCPPYHRTASEHLRLREGPPADVLVSRPLCVCSVHSDIRYILLLPNFGVGNNAVVLGDCTRDPLHFLLKSGFVAVLHPGLR